MANQEQQDEEYLMDHSYDGIQEFDNPLPGWWVNLFWGTVLFAIPYLLYYEMGIGPSIHDELSNQAAVILEQQSEKYKGVVITADLLEEKLSDTTMLGGMKQKFIAKCATCHKSRGEGDAGPNLTDDYWLHGGDIVSIFNTIRNGVPGKTMKAWEGELGLGGVIGMAAYVSTMRGTNVPGKSKEGAFYDLEQEKKDRESKAESKEANKSSSDSGTGPNTKTDEKAANK